MNVPKQMTTETDVLVKLRGQYAAMEGEGLDSTFMDDAMHCIALLEAERDQLRERVRGLEARLYANKHLPSCGTFFGHVTLYSDGSSQSLLGPCTCGYDDYKAARQQGDAKS